MQKIIYGVHLFGVAILSIFLVVFWIIYLVGSFMTQGSQSAMTYITNIYAQTFNNETKPERNGADGSDK